MGMNFFKIFDRKRVLQKVYIFKNVGFLIPILMVFVVNCHDTKRESSAVESVDNSKTSVVVEPKSYKAIPGEAAEGGIPISPAKLVVGTGPQSCIFTAPSHDPAFGAYPQVSSMTNGSGERFFLFSAVGHAGGSGGEIYLALLKETPDKLQNVLPYMVIPTISEYKIFDEPTVSNFPILVIAEHIWKNNEAHFDKHYYKIAIYTMDTVSGLYSNHGNYTTKQKFASDGWQVDILKYERKSIMTVLTKR